MIEAGPAFTIDLTVVTLGAFTVGMLLEMFRPARESVISIARWLNNGGLALLTYLSNHLLGTFLAVVIVQRFSLGYSLGLDSLPLWLNVAVVFLAMEFVRYLVHVAMHKLPILWRLHAVHHADGEVDISTAFRHHPFEAALTAIPLVAVMLLFSGAPEALVLYRACDLVMAVLTHTNTAVPVKLERWLRYLVVTPAFHRTHHLAQRRFTDSNYSSSIPWFDYLFGTYQPTTDEQRKYEKIGLDTHTPNEQRLDGMLIAPFTTRRS